MFRYTLKMYGRILASCLKVVGLGKAFWIWLLLVPLYAGFSQFTLLLDRIFFRSYRRVEIRNPIFIFGHPRSGTTFLQRLLTQTREFAAFEAWELLFPALTVRPLLKPIVNLLAKSNKEILIPAEIGHEVRLTAIDEDEALFFHLLDTEMITNISPIGFVDKELSELLFHDRQPHEEKSILIFRDLWKRQILCTGRERMISKLPPSILRLKTLLRVFPDAKIIYLIRFPIEVIQSFLSLHWKGVQTLWGPEKLSQAQIRFFFRRKYEVSVRWYSYMHKLIEDGEIPQEQLLEITYDEQMEDLQGVLKKIVEFTGITISPELQSKIDQRFNRQRSYKRRHRVLSLEQFDLTEKQIRSDLKAVFDRYHFD